jgi:hypothetical protein
MQMPADTIQFSGVIRSPDVHSKSVVVQHVSTGYEVSLRADSAALSLVKEADLDEIADGQPIRLWVGSPKVKDATIQVGSQLIQPLKEGAATEGIKGPEITGCLVKRKKTAEDPANALLSRNGAEVLGIRVNGQKRIFLSRYKARPHSEIVTAGEFSDLQPGREMDVTLGKENQPLNAKVYDRLPGGPPYYMHTPGGSSGTTTEEIESKVAEAKNNHGKIDAQLARLMPVKMTVWPELVNADEPVVLRMEVLADHVPASNPVLTLNHLQEHPGSVQELTMEWKQTGEAFGMNRYVAEASLPTSTPGQHVVTWSSDVGGDISDFYRNYGVVTPETSICTFQINNFPPDLQKTVFDLKLPFHFWAAQVLEFPTWVNPKMVPSRWANVSQLARRCGAAPECSLLYFPWGSAQVREDPPDVQRAGLEAIQQMAPLFNFPFAADTFWQYTMGTETVNIARSLGFKSVSALCTEFHCDGNMGINHFGHPERPYFVSPEDFRKSGLSPDGHNMIGLSQVQRHTLLAREYLCDYNIEPGNGGLNIGAGGRTVWDDMALSRVFDAYDALFQLQTSQTVPFVIQQCLEFSGNRPGAAEGNRKMLQYAVEKARTQPVVFASSHGLVDYYLRHYHTTPETVSYQQDYWAAFTPTGPVGRKPVLYPDYMQMENSRFNTYAVYGEILPKYHYDYTRPWHYPDFGNEHMKRRRDGFGYPAGDSDRFAVTPKITDTRGMRASQAAKELPNGSLAITLTVSSDEPQPDFPLAIWNIPRAFRKGTGWYTVSGGRFVPIKAPYSGNLNGFIVTDLKKGENEVTLTLASEQREPVSQDIDCGPLLVGKVFTRDGRSMAYIAPTRPWNVTAKLAVPAGREVTVAVAPEGTLQVFGEGSHTFVIPKEQWARVIGLNREELTQFLSAD